MAEIYDKVPIPYLELIQTDGTGIFKTKIWLQWLQQKIDRVYEKDIEPIITGKEIAVQKYKDKQTNIRKDLLWAFGPTAVHENTTT